MVLFGLALMVGGAGVLVALRDELGIPVPGFLVALLDRMPSYESVRASAAAAPRVVGRAAVPEQTILQSAIQTGVQERVRRRLQTEREARPRQPSAETRRQRPVSFPRAVGRASPPASSRSHPGPMT